ncbi:MAG: hypothetical protein ACOYMY_03240 [Prochlorococcaceae cyanobacterium]
MAPALLLRGIALVPLLVLVPGVGRAAPALPFPQALEISRRAADAVVRQTGSENCLRGKLTNAMVTLSDSCDASGRQDTLCRLADQVVMETSSLTMTVMEDTAQKLLRLTAVADR